jgi:MATE family multidrug resistance protein
MIGSGFTVLSNAFASFYSGRKLTWTIMKINIIGNVVNVVIAYIFIFGKFGFPELGIEGAGWAGVTGQIIIFLIYAVTFYLLKNKSLH